MDTIFCFTDCTLTLGNRRLFSALNLKIDKGDFITIHGRSGTGKSTLIQLLLGFLQPTDGRVLFRGNEYDRKVLSLLRATVAVVFQEPVFLAETVEEAILQPFGFRCNRGLYPDRSEIDYWLNKLELDIKLDAAVSSISGGEKQRLALLRALLLKRDILILDEVTSALDSEHRELVFNLVAQLSVENGTTVIAVSHDTNWIAASERTFEMGGNIGGEGR